MSATWELLADLPLRVDSCALTGLRHRVNTSYVRMTTVVELHGGGATGLGEDVVYDAAEQERVQAQGATLPLAGDWTLATFSEHLAGLALFSTPQSYEVHTRYRTWAYESAALDLALRQTAGALHELLGRPPRPVRFVVSPALGEPPTFEPIESRLARYPDMRFKLDAKSAWDEPLIERLAATGAVDTLDFKGLYDTATVGQGADADLYRRAIEAFPHAWLEDPALTPETDALLAPHRGRVTWDVPIHTAADLQTLPFQPRMINIKPSRSGSLRDLLELYDHCAAAGISAYGGGQFELGPGRGQIQYLASLFHPDGPNDVAPVGYHANPVLDGLPGSPLDPAPSPIGFRWS